MSFEEEFPNLKNRIVSRQTYDSIADQVHGKDKYISKSDLIVYGLDKQRVKEIIQGWMKHYKNHIGTDEIECCEHRIETLSLILKELGL